MKVTAICLYGRFIMYCTFIIIEKTMKEIISSSDAPEAIGPYSHATAFGGLVFTSGQLPIDKNIGKVVSGGIVEQSKQSLKNLKSVLEAGGASTNSVLKTTCFLANIEDFQLFNDVYTEMFPDNCPARSCFAVKELPLGVLIEVEAIAYKE
ncbi:hypothetical protein MACH09_10950 [Vibrio sp. MACH09]|nr:hypothetical protein MACH09_10950 [Vibrio sp. MACH09]